MVTDLVQECPPGSEWDGENVDLAVILVNTPSAGSHLDYTDLLTAIRTYLAHADFILVRSTVDLDFLTHPVYRVFGNRIGFSPEFYGATKWSRRGVLDLGFSIYTPNVPEWFRDITATGDVMIAEPGEVILAKLAENAFLATKVTFFHELQIAAAERGLDPEAVRKIVTADPRIGAGHSHMEEPGWSSHCFDKDVPAYARTAHSTLVDGAILANRTNLLPRRNR
uniref:UDP-glucose dehydrogenase n=2 Tax=unclassified bacterial viruses TaxID=12333 RepID=A0AAU7J8H9_9VIRU